MAETLGSLTVSTKLQRIAKLAKELSGAQLTTLAHHIDIDWLREAHRRTRKGGAKGVDGQSAEEYAETLEGNLAALLERAKSGTYRAPPVRRVQIPKGDGKQTRPIGIPTWIRSCSAPWRCCSEPCTSRSFTTSRTGFAQGALRIKRYKRSGTARWGWPAGGSWRSTYVNSSPEGT